MNIKPFKLERYYTKHEHTATYSLCNSDCEAMTIGALLSLEDGASEAFHNSWLGYTHTEGSPELRKDISAIYFEYKRKKFTGLFGCTRAYIFIFSGCFKCPR